MVFWVWITLIFHSGSVKAQDTSWRAILIVFVHGEFDKPDEYESCYHDTVYIGVHEKGGDGFQKDLDILDTGKRRSMIDVRSGDAEAGKQLGLPCARFGTNIKHYRKSPVIFDMYVQFEESIFDGNRDIWLKIDTTDFIWQKGKYKVLSLRLFAFNGYIGGMDAK